MYTFLAQKHPNILCQWYQIRKTDYCVSCYIVLNTMRTLQYILAFNLKFKMIAHVLKNMKNVFFIIWRCLSEHYRSRQDDSICRYRQYAENHNISKIQGGIDSIVNTRRNDPIFWAIGLKDEHRRLMEAKLGKTIYSITLLWKGKACSYTNRQGWWFYSHGLIW
jgi:hypothetical protein